MQANSTRRNGARRLVLVGSGLSWNTGVESDSSGAFSGVVW